MKINITNDNIHLYVDFLEHLDELLDNTCNKELYDTIIHIADKIWIAIAIFQEKHKQKTIKRSKSL